MSELIACMHCRKKRMRLGAERYTAELKHDGRPYPIDIPDLSVYRCMDCAESFIIPDESDRRIGLELRKVAGLLMPEEIKAISILAGSQKDLADHLGISESTVCRWVTGAQIQQRCFDKELKAYRDLPELRNYFAGKDVSVEGSISSQTIQMSAPPELSHSPFTYSNAAGYSVVLTQGS